MRFPTTLFPKLDMWVAPMNILKAKMVSLLDNYLMGGAQQGSKRRVHCLSLFVCDSK